MCFRPYYYYTHIGTQVCVWVYAHVTITDRKWAYRMLKPNITHKPYTDTILCEINTNRETSGRSVVVEQEGSKDGEICPLFFLFTTKGGSVSTLLLPSLPSFTELVYRITANVA